MIPWKRWGIYGISTLLGAVIGLTSALLPYGYVVVSIVLGAAAAGAAKRIEHILFTSALTLTFVMFPHDVNLLVSVVVTLSTAIICRAMRGSEQPSQ